MSDTITGSTVADLYKVTGFLRPGRMGDNYVARRLEDDAKVAIKFLDRALFQNDEAVARFERESRVSRAIDHPCTIRLLDFGRSQHGPFIVTEYVEGELLAEVIEDKGALPPERAAVITARIALALQAAHDAGVVHRDLAPQNVILGRQGKHTDLVKVSDFGLALLTHEEDGEESAHLTAVGVRIGTPTYMAPEYIEEYELDARADIYGLGVMLFEMLTGQPPFTGRPYKVMDAHVNDPMPKPSSRKAEVPAWLDALVVRMTAKRPDQRLQTAGEVAQAIEKGLGRAIDLQEYRAPTAEKAPKRSEQPKRSVAPGDPILEHFLANNAGTVTRTKAPPPPVDRRFLVSRVAPLSVAGRLGVAAGWWAHLPDEQSTGLLDPDLHHHVVADRRWWFFTPDAAERIELRTSGVPVGVELMGSAENIVREYDPLIPSVRALLDLWHQRRWDDLERLSWRTLTQTKAQGGLFSRIVTGVEKAKLFDHPALLFHGAAQLEQLKPEGLRSIMDFKAKYASRWPAVFSAIADFHLADAAKRVDPKRALDLVNAAVLQEPLPRMVAMYQELNGLPPNTTPWLGKTWNDYSMDTVDRRVSATLSGTLQEMDSSQLLCVCMLGGFRSNQDYDEFMHRWAHYSAFFTPFLHALHVVTASTEVDVEKPTEHRGENVVRSSGLPMLLLHDYRAYMQRAVKPASIPTIYLLDQQGTCVHEGHLTPCDLWEALAFAGRLRIERFSGGER